MSKVLNKSRDTPTEQSVYVGRPSKWGNIFIIGKHGTREEVLDKYEKYLYSSGLYLDLDTLRGKDLVCHCAPQGCHADVLLRLANGKATA